MSISLTSCLVSAQRLVESLGNGKQIGQCTDCVPTVVLELASEPGAARQNGPTSQGLKAGRTMHSVERSVWSYELSSAQSVGGWEWLSVPYSISGRNAGFASASDL